MSGILQGLLPIPRIIPKLRINYYEDTKRVKVEGSAYGTLPATGTLVAKYMTTIVSGSKTSEIYALCDPTDGDLESFLAVSKEGSTTSWEAARCGSREFKIYFDDVLAATWPAESLIGRWANVETA